MADRYDPYISRDPTGEQQDQDPNDKRKKVQEDIDKTIKTMQGNLNQMSERGGKLDALQDKTDNLAQSAQGFRKGANRVRKQMWWKDMKMRMCLIVGIIILLVIIIVPSVLATK